MVKPKKYEDDLNLVGDFDKKWTIGSITFKQTGDSETRSRFYNVQVYNGVSTTPIGRTKNSITLELDFNTAVTSIDPADLYYLPSVLMQDEFGDYSKAMNSASKRLSLVNSSTTNGNKEVTVSGQ